MSRPPSPETEIKNLKRLLRNAMRDRDEARREATAAKRQAAVLDASLNGWIARFDALLRRDEATRSPGATTEGR